MPSPDKRDIELSVNEISIKGFRVNQHIDYEGVQYANQGEVWHSLAVQTQRRTDKIHYLLQYIAQYFHDLYKVAKQWSGLTNIDDFITGLKENISTRVSNMQLMAGVSVSSMTKVTMVTYVPRVNCFY